MDVKNTAINMALGLTGRSYVLVMQHYGLTRNSKDPFKPVTYDNNPDISFHPREHQPCWGELRKYERDYPGQCTEPKKEKPGDLHHPFPAGKPIGFASLITTNKSAGSPEQDTFYKDIFNHKVSPWAPGLTDKIEFIKGTTGKIVGIWTPDLHVDPTVFVNLLRYVGYGAGAARNYELYLEHGMTKTEALATMKLASGTNSLYYLEASGYSLSRFLLKSPRDLSGGYFDDRVDYNRTMQDEIFFCGPEMKKTSYSKLLQKYKLNTLVSFGIDMKDFVERVRAFYSEALPLEDKPVRPLFIWKKSNGETNGPNTVQASKDNQLKGVA